MIDKSRPEFQQPIKNLNSESRARMMCFGQLFNFFDAEDNPFELFLLFRVRMLKLTTAKMSLLLDVLS